MSRQQQNEPTIPHAPYPPQFEKPVKSALALNPNYQSKNSFSGNEITGGYEVPSRGGDELSPTGTSAAEKGKADKQIPARLKFYHKPTDVVACINCKPSKQHRGANEPASIENTRLRKAPLLLELRQLQPVKEYSDETATLFDARPIGASRGNPSLGSSVVSTCLDLPLGVSHSESRFIAATGLSTGMLCIHSIYTDPSSDIPSSIEYFHTPRSVMFGF